MFNINQNKSSLTITVGLIAAGKSFWARQYCQENPKVFRVNKDELRNTCLGGRNWTPKQEGIINDIQMSIVREILSKDHRICVIDDTSLNPKVFQKWENLAKELEVNFTVKDFRHVPLATCLENNRKRTGKERLDDNIIINMAFKYKLTKQERPFVLIDIDGTLADCTDRKNLAIKPNGDLDWGIFLEPKNISLDKPIKVVIEDLWKEHDEGNEIILVSARNESQRMATESWLHVNVSQWEDPGIIRNPWSRLIMRQDGDYRPDEVVKKEFLDNYLDKTKCVRIYDDRKKVLDMWKSNGIEVVVCGDLPDGSDF